MIHSSQSLVIMIVLLLLFSIINSDRRSARLFHPALTIVGENRETGFEPVDCWFERKWWWPQSECFYVHVPEDHAQPYGRIIKFPLVIFRSNSWFGGHKAPVLHLGAGGPGGTMQLSSSEAVARILKDHDDFSLKQGRDLFVIDPRGAGLSQPLLVCKTFLENEERRMQANFTLYNEWQESRQDYETCIRDFQSGGVKLTAYNSLSVIHDIELMRQAAHEKKWVLVGVSYSTIYAQLIASRYPQTVESMILDSAAFPNLKLDHEFVKNALQPYAALYNYCDSNPSCTTPLVDVQQRIWNLRDELNHNPVETRAWLYSGKRFVPLLLTGDRFIKALVFGVYYGSQIYEDLPVLIAELEQRKTGSMEVYLDFYTNYLLDPEYADLSMLTHFCYDDRKFIDLDGMQADLQSLPAGYIRDEQRFFIESFGLCDGLEVGRVDPVVAQPVRSTIPALFLQGDMDIVTPLDDVESQLGNFREGKLVIFNHSHGLLHTIECPEEIAARFIQDPQIEASQLICE